MLHLLAHTFTGRSVPRDQRSNNLFHLHAPRPFHQQQIAGHYETRQKFGGLLRRREKFRACAGEPRGHGAFHDLRRITGNADDPIDLPGLCSELPCLAMQFQ